MFQLAPLLPYQLLIYENLTNMTSKYIVYNAGGSQTVVNSETTLFDFQIRVAVSPYGALQRFLLAPSTSDTRAIVFAITQLLAYEHHQQNQTQQQQQQRGPLRGAAAAAAVAAGDDNSNTSYKDFKQLCRQVNRRLPRSDVPLELVATEAPAVPHGEAFSSSTGDGEYKGCKLYCHKTFRRLQVVYIEGEQLLKVLDGFCKEAAEDLGGITSAEAGLLQAVEIGLEVAARLASFLDGYISTSSNSNDNSSSRNGAEIAAAAGSRGGGSAAAGGGGRGVQPCRVLLVENLLLAVSYATRAQHKALMGQVPATKSAAARQAGVQGLDLEAITQWLWLWVVAFVLKQGWHMQLCQSKDSVRLFLDTVGSRCAWLAGKAAQEEEEDEDEEEQQQQRVVHSGGQGEELWEQRGQREQQQQQRRRQESYGNHREEEVWEHEDQLEEGPQQEQQQRRERFRFQREEVWEHEDLREEQEEAVSLTLAAAVAATRRPPPGAVAAGAGVISSGQDELDLDAWLQRQLQQGQDKQQQQQRQQLSQRRKRARYEEQQPQQMVGGLPSPSNVLQPKPSPGVAAGRVACRGDDGAAAAAGGSGGGASSGTAGDAAAAHGAPLGAAAGDARVDGGGSAPSSSRKGARPLPTVDLTSSQPDWAMMGSVGVGVDIVGRVTPQRLRRAAAAAATAAGGAAGGAMPHTADEEVIVLL
jgi:hypothetical protein